MKQYDMSSLTMCFSLYHGPTDLTAFGVDVFESDQLCIEEQSGRTMFTHAWCRREEE